MKKEIHEIKKRVFLDGVSIFPKDTLNEEYYTFNNRQHEIPNERNKDEKRILAQLFFRHMKNGFG